jgi:hypothetical protein
MCLALGIVLLTAALLLVHEVLRRGGARIACAAFVALPVALTPDWIATHDFGPFAWAKLYMVLFSACWLTALRFTTLGCRRWALAAAPVLLALNILEAVAVDVAAGRAANLLNAVAGLLLIAKLPRSAGGVQIDSAGGNRDLHCSGFTRGWIVTFSLWNWAFLFLNFPVIAGHHVAVLGAVLAIGLIDPRRWLQARMFVLAVDLVALATFTNVLVPRTDTTHWSDPHLELFVAGAALASALGCARSSPICPVRSGRHFR